MTALDSAGQHDPSADPSAGHGTDSERGLRTDVAWGLHNVVVGMNRDNFLVRPHLRLVEQYAQWPAWYTLTVQAAGDLGENLAGLPSSALDNDEQARRFDLLILRRQLAQLEGDALAAERVREKVQNIASDLLTKTNIPSVAAQQELIESVASDEWWVDAPLPALELVRLRLRALVGLLDPGVKMAVYTDFEDEISDSTLVDLPGVTPGTN